MYIAGSGTPYWYEWEVGLLECLKMMSDATIQSVTLQSVDFQSLDDVVVKYNDGSIVNIQVKHSDIGENFTYSTLTSGKSPMLDKWAKEWQKEKSNYNIKEIRIVTNRPWGTNASDGKCSFDNFVKNVFPKIQADFAYQNQEPTEAAACAWFKTQITYLGSDAYDFIKILNFCREDDLSGVDAKIRDRVSLILGTDRKEAVDAATNSLLAKLNEWSTSKRSRQEIYREDIYNALCVSSVDFPEYELYPEKPIFPSRESFAVSFLEQLQQSDKKMFFLQGLPGSGKTNFVSYLAQLDNSIVDFRFYTYLPVNKDYPSFSDDEGYYTGDFLWRSLLTQLKKRFEKHNLLYKLNFPLIYNYLSVTEMKDAVLKYLPEYANLIGRTCYVFIDGLDHAARSSNARDSFLAQLPHPDEITGNIKMVLVGQPINDKYPRQLSNNNQIEYLSLPVLAESDIIMLLSKENISIHNIDPSSLAKSIIGVVGNNALNVLFAIREIKQLNTDISFDSIIAYLQERNLNGHIDRYYEWIISSIEDGALLLKIKILFAFASQKISAQDIADMCGESVENVIIILNKLYPLIERDLNEYYTFHNDVRLFLKESMIANSNYETLTLSIHNKVLENENLHRYKYDILFGTALELKDKQIVFDLFSPNYIVKSIQYKISVNKLVQQFYTLTQIIRDSETLINIDKISAAASTISQYINNIQYNVKEDLFYDDRTRRSKTESEKYILSVEEKINDIVYDIYTLLKNNFIDRARVVFDEYLKKITFNRYLTETRDESDLDYCKRCGYVCRFFASNIFEHDEEGEEADSSLYLKFVEGWLDASSKFISVEDIVQTFSFKYYRFEYLNEFTARICSEGEISPDVFNKLCEIYLSGNDKPISSLVDLCVYGILHDQIVDELQQAIILRQEDILTSDEFKYDSDRIPYYIKSYFCLFTKTDVGKDIPKLYTEILKKSHVTPEQRGYVPAISQLSLTKRICKDFFEGNKNCDGQIRTIYDTAYFTQQHGTGSSHDCNAYAVRTFLLKVLFFTHANESKTSRSKLLEICDGISDMFIWRNSIYVNELTELFYIANAKETFLNIVDHWCGTHGILWNQSYSDVEYCGSNIVKILHRFGLTDEANKIEKIVLFKLFGYVDHKDYSLSGLLDCYKQLPLSEEKLLFHGMKLLTISDAARSIGDNRMRGEIEDVVFETAANLGIKYIASLFELKNNPNDFYNWRNCFLDVYYKKLLSEDFSDDELLALYNLVNAWISEEIESSIKHGSNQVEHLYHYNYRIIEKIKNEELRNTLNSRGKTSPKAISNIDDYVVKTKDNDKYLVDEIRQNGYSQDVEKKIVATFSDLYGGQARLLVDIGDIIDISNNRNFISNCVIRFIVTRRKYGYRSAGLNELIYKFYSYFSNDDWLKLFHNIVESISLTNMENFYSINEDIETLCLYYYLGTIPDKLAELYSNKLNTHWCWVTSCDLLNWEPYTLAVDANMTSLELFAKYQLGTQ